MTLPGAPDENLLDMIYEAAILADGWPAVLDRIAALHGARGGALFAQQMAGVRWTASAGIRTDYEDFIALGWHTRNTRVARGAALNHAGFICDTQMYTEAEMAEMPIYRDFFAPRGLRAGAGTFFPGVNGDDLVVTLEGFESHEHVRDTLPRLDALRPHLARAAMLASRLELQRARVAAAALALVGIPAAILGGGRRVLAANALFETELSGFGHDTPRGLFLADALADARLDHVLRTGHAPRQGASIPLRWTEGAPAVLHIVPVCGNAQDIIAGALSIVMVARPGPRGRPSLELIQGFLDLTPAEARLARDLTGGCSLSQAAALAKISPATARTHLKNIFGKTGLSRQSELTALLSGLSLPAGVP